LVVVGEGGMAQATQMWNVVKISVFAASFRPEGTTV